ncbi:MAG: hypothetical protein JWM80_1106, partial [Cyanobacteria bacterium RYN_339]|nr:hypothetical protein [Cyanobacteria bacterium RYN_339]
NPTATDGPERTVSARPKAASTGATTAKLPASTTAAAKTSTTTPVAKAATTTATTTAKAAATTPAKTATTTTVQVADPNAPGSLAVNIKVSGTATVASLSLKIFDPKAPDQALEAPLKLASGAAAWNEKEVGAGDYTMQVKALAADGTVLGSGTTNASVKAGEPTEVNLDLKVNAAAAAPVLPTGGTQVNAQSNDPTPKPSATPTPAPTAPPQVGGTLGLNIEVL